MITDRWLKTIKKTAEELRSLQLTENEFIAEFDLMGYKISDPQVFLGVYYYKNYKNPKQIKARRAMFYKPRNYV